MRQSWVLSEAGRDLGAQGRLSEELLAQRAALRMDRAAENWRHAAISAYNLSRAELLVGEVAGAMGTAEQSVRDAGRSDIELLATAASTGHANALHAAGRRGEAERLFAHAERRQKELRPEHPLHYSVRGYQYCDLLLAKGAWTSVRDRASQTLKIARRNNWLQDIALDTLTIGRAYLEMALEQVAAQPRAATADEEVNAAPAWLEQALDALRAAGQLDDVPRGLLARAAFRRSAGDWEGAARDLDEVEEIAEPGPMRLFLCDMALERARLAFARIAAFAPLNGLIDDGPPQPVPPGAGESAKLTEEARANLATARVLIERCGYHRRDEELAELEAVRDGRRRFADLPPRV
jgi:tetratricopeptide (TPR) repeat protein